MPRETARQLSDTATQGPRLTENSVDRITGPAPPQNNVEPASQTTPQEASPSPAMPQESSHQDKVKEALKKLQSGEIDYKQLRVLCKEGLGMMSLELTTEVVNLAISNQQKAEKRPTGKELLAQTRAAREAKLKESAVELTKKPEEPKTNNEPKVLLDASPVSVDKYLLADKMQEITNLNLNKPVIIEIPQSQTQDKQSEIVEETEQLVVMTEPELEQVIQLTTVEDIEAPVQSPIIPRLQPSPIPEPVEAMSNPPNKTKTPETTPEIIVPEPLLLETKHAVPQTHITELTLELKENISGSAMENETIEVNIVDLELGETDYSEPLTITPTIIATVDEIDIASIVAPRPEPASLVVEEQPVVYTELQQMIDLLDLDESDQVTELLNDITEKVIELVTDHQEFTENTTIVNKELIDKCIALLTLLRMPQTEEDAFKLVKRLFVSHQTNIESEPVWNNRLFFDSEGDHERQSNQILSRPSINPESQSLLGRFVLQLHAA